MVFEILSFGFMQNAIISGIAISLVCSTVGLFLVLRKYSLFGDALAHSAFGGVALGLFLGVYPLWAAYVVSILSALALTKIRQKFDISGDAIIAILLSSGIAIGIVLISLSGGFSIDIFSFLFGSILLVSTENVIMVLGLCAAILIILITGYKKFMYITFSEEQASFGNSSSKIKLFVNCDSRNYSSNINAISRCTFGFSTFCNSKCHRNDV